MKVVVSLLLVIGMIHAWDVDVTPASSCQTEFSGIQDDTPIIAGESNPTPTVIPAPGEGVEPALMRMNGKIRNISQNTQVLNCSPSVVTSLHGVRGAGSVFIQHKGPMTCYLSNVDWKGNMVQSTSETSTETQVRSMVLGFNEGLPYGHLDLTCELEPGSEMISLVRIK